MTQEERYRDANRRAEASRAAFFASVDLLKGRVKPARLKADAMAKAKTMANDTKEHTLNTVRAHPFAISATIVAATAFLLRKPVARLVQKYATPAPAPATQSAKNKLGKQTRHLRTALSLAWRTAPHYLPKLLRRMS